VIVIYDGQCEFCLNCVKWIQSRISLEAIPYQEADLTQHMLSEQEAQESMHLVLADRTLSGADAVAHLLKSTRWRGLGLMISTFLPLSRFCYGWVARHRNSAIVRFINLLVMKTIDQGR
jgi:predicted DCC family thiol-disulfide oxidoreductase YuxK